MAATIPLPRSHLQMETTYLPTKLLDNIKRRIDASSTTTESLDLASFLNSFGHIDECLALSFRIRQCAQPSNIWVGIPDAMDSSPDPFYPSGRLWRCNSKLCPDCVAKQSQRNRRLLIDSVSQQILRRNEKWYFATFTITNPKASLVKTRSIVNRAWSLFRKRSLCVALIRGGSKSEEFTITANGYHYHLHCLFLSKFIHFNSFRHTWTDCVETAFDEHEIPFEVKTSDGSLFIKIKPVVPNHGLYHELCKYITKSDSWSKMKGSALVEAALLQRWPRMFELFGSMAARNLASDSDALSIVHTRLITDGSSRRRSSSWRKIAEFANHTAYSEHLTNQLASGHLLRQVDVAGSFPAHRIFTYEEILHATNHAPASE